MILSFEQKAVKETIRKFVDKEYPPEAARLIDDQDHFPRDLLNKMADNIGMLGVTIPEEYEGSGRDIVSAAIICEELARRSTALAWVFAECVFFGGENINRLGSKEQREYFLPKIARGELLFSYALTEPNAGSDTAAAQTFAEQVAPGKFVINGSKIFISGASYCDYILLLARTDRSVAKHRGLTFFIVSRHQPGIVTRPIKKVGCHGSDTCELFIENVSADIEDVLGGPGCLNRGWDQLLDTLDVEHIHVAAEGVGLAEGALELALKYVNERVQFDRPVGKFQAIRHTLAEMATEVEAARLLTYHAAQLAQRMESCRKESAMAKWFSTETAKKVSLQSLQLHGGYGCTMEYDIQRFARDSLIYTVGGGTTEIQKNMIAKMLGL